MKLLPYNSSAVSEANCDNETCNDVMWCLDTAKGQFVVWIFHVWVECGAGYAFCHDCSMRGWPLVGRSSIENDRNLRRHLILKNCFLEFGLFKTPCCLQDVPRRGLSVQRVPSWFCGQWSPTMPTWGHEAASCVSHRGCLWWFDVAGGYSGSFRLFPPKKAAVLRPFFFWVFCRLKVSHFWKVHVIFVWCIRPSSAKGPSHEGVKHMGH